MGAHGFDLSDRHVCERHCKHPLDAERHVPLAWCCRCGNILAMPPGLEWEEKNHGCFPPRLLIEPDPRTPRTAP